VHHAVLCIVPPPPNRTTQTYHGGQDWRGLDNFREDFSVTTNGLGTPAGALEAARKAASSCFAASSHHHARSCHDRSRHARGGHAQDTHTRAGEA
jgi:hypothetical protein